MTVLEQINEIYEGAKRRDRNFNEANYYWSIGSDVLAEISRCLTVSGSTILLNGIRVDGDVIRKRRIALCGNRYKERNYSNYYTNPPYKIKNVIFNDPATIVYWADGTKTVVKVQNGEKFDPEKGLAMAISKKALGNQGNYFETFKKYCPVKKNINVSCKECKYRECSSYPCVECDDYDEFEPAENK